MARGSIRGLVDPIVSVVRLSINFDGWVVVASWLLGVDDCHRCILDLHSVILDDGFWSWFAILTSWVMIVFLRVSGRA